MESCRCCWIARESGEIIDQWRCIEEEDVEFSELGRRISIAEMIVKRLDIVLWTSGGCIDVENLVEWVGSTESERSRSVILSS